MKMESHIWTVASVIRLVADMNIDAVCSTAKQFKGLSEDEIDDEMIYNVYCHEVKRNA